MKDDFFDIAFGQFPVLGIVQPHSVTQVITECNAAWDVGIRLVEVLMRGPFALDVLRAAVAAGRERGMPVGAGTILSREGMEIVFRAGAAYAVSPGFDSDLVRYAARQGMHYLPGVATPSEVQLAAAAGLRWVKAFPAQVLTPAWFAAVREPFPDMKFVATGGITRVSAQSFLAAGARALGVGRALREVVQVLPALSPFGST